MDQSLERLLASLPQKKLSRKADLMIRLRLWRTQAGMTLSGLDFSMAKGWQAGLASALVVLVCLSGTGVYAYSSDKVTRQSRLYPIKRTLENIEKSVISSPTAQPALEAKFAARRFAEARAMISHPGDPRKISDDLDLTLDEANENIRSANENIGSIENQDEQERLIERLDAENDRHSRDLEVIAIGLSLDDDEKIVDAVANSLENLEQQKKFLKSRSKKNSTDLSAKTNPAATATSAPPQTATTSTSTAAVLTTKKERSEKDEEIESLKQMKKRVESFKKEQEKKQKQKQKPNLKAEKFIKNLEKKVDQAEASIKQGDRESFQRIYDTTTALTNTGIHFIASSSEIAAEEKREETNKPTERESSEEQKIETKREQESERHREDSDRSND